MSKVEAWQKIKKFVSNITQFGGPYMYLTGTSIIPDAYDIHRAIAEIEKEDGMPNPSELERTAQLHTPTRVVLVDHTKDMQGRVYDKSNVTVELAYQDGGRTLKVFVT